jgi:hypothetical protein
MLIIVYGSGSRYGRCSGLMAWYYHFVAMMTSVGRTIVNSILKNSLHLCHVHNGEELGKEQEQGKEQAKCSYIYPNINPGGREHYPARGQIIAVQGRNDDYEALEPHTNVHNY